MKTKKTIFILSALLICGQAYSFSLGNLIPDALRFKSGEQVLVKCGKALKKARVESVSSRNNITISFNDFKSDILCGGAVYTQTQIKKYRAVDSIPSIKGVFSMYDDIAVKCSGKFKRASVTSLSFFTSAHISFSLDNPIDALTCSIGGSNNHYSLSELIRNGEIKKY